VDTEFYGYDGHGNVRFIENTTSAVTDSYDYDAFGMSIRTTGTTANQFLYGGERYDSGMGKYDLRARYYNEATGRFWSRDPYEGARCSPPSLNPYIYTWNDPVDRLDPLGRGATVETAELDLAALLRGIAATYLLVQPLICHYATDASGVRAVTQADVLGHPQTLYRAGPCALSSKILPSDCPPAEREPTPSNPGFNPFDPIRGAPCKINRNTGEVWCRDQLHKDHWEVYKNKRDWERSRRGQDTRDRSVWDNGCLRQRF
jgi:RHS repeat-associated protein